MEEARKLSCDMCVLIRGMGEEQLMLPLQHLSMALCNVTAVTSTQIVILIALLICLPLQMSIWSHLGDLEEVTLSISFSQEYCYSQAVTPLPEIPPL